MDLDELRNAIKGYNSKSKKTNIIKKQDIERTEEMQLSAVKKNGLALGNVKIQTEEMCLAAVRQNGLALEYVKKPNT